MNKLLQLGCLILALVFCGKTTAQEILLEELFNDTTLGVFTAYSSLGDGQVWEPREFDGKMFAQMNGFDGGIQDNEDWLISPALDMDVYSDEILTFENASNFNGPDLEVMVSTDYDGSSDPNTATWTDLSENVTWSGGGYEYVLSGELDLSAFTGTGYFAFKYISNADVEGKLWQIDSVVVSASILSNIDEAAQTEQLISQPVVQGDQLSFEVLLEQKAMDFAIYALEGRQLLQFSNNAYQNTINLPIANLAAGMYVLHAKSERGIQSYKFMKY